VSQAQILYGLTAKSSEFANELFTTKKIKSDLVAQIEAKSLINLFTLFSVNILWQ